MTQSVSSRPAFRLIRNALSNFAGLGLTLIASFFLTPVIIHKLGLVAYGIWILANGLVSYTGLLDAGLAPTVVKKSAEYLARDARSQLSRMVSLAFTLYLVLGVLVLIVLIPLVWLVPQLFHVPAGQIGLLRIAIVLVGIQIALSFPASLWSGLLMGLQDFHIRNLLIVVSTLLRFAGTLGLLFLGFGLTSLLLLGLALSLLTWVVNVWWVHRRMPSLSITIYHHPKWAEIKDFLGFSSLMSINQLAGTALHYSSSVVIALFLPVSFVGLYEVGGKANNFLRMVARNMVNIAMPSSSELDALGDFARIRQLFITGAKAMLAFYAAATIPALVFGQGFFLLWLGPGFEEAYWIMFILLAGSLYQSQIIVGHVILRGTGRLRMLTISAVGSSSLGLALSVAFINIWGVRGVAAAVSLPLLLFDTWMTVYVCRVLGIRVWQFLTACNMRVAVPAILAGGILAWLSTLYYPRSWVALGVAVLLFETAFLGLVWLLTLTSRERTLFLETARLRTVRLALGNLIPKYGASRS